MMTAIGLEPSDTGRPGGKRIGDRMSHYIVAGGPFDVACKAFLSKDQGLTWGDRPPKPQTGGKRSKYIFSSCGLAAWAKPCVQLLCNEHDGDAVRMAEVVPLPV